MSVWRGKARLCANEPRTPKDAAAFRAHHYTRDDTHTDTYYACVRQYINAKVHKALHHADVSTAIVEFLIAMQRDSHEII